MLIKHFFQQKSVYVCACWLFFSRWKFSKKWQRLLRHFIFNHLNQFFISPPLWMSKRNPHRSCRTVCFFIFIGSKCNTQVYYHYYFIIVVVDDEDVVIAVVVVLIIAMFHRHTLSIRGRIISSPHINASTQAPNASLSLWKKSMATLSPHLQVVLFRAWNIFLSLIV